MALSYSYVEGWGQAPAEYPFKDVVGVQVAPDDRVYILTRFDSQVLVFESDGRFVRSFAQGVFTPRTHGLTLGPDGSLFCVDDGDHTVRKFNAAGEMVMMIGTPGVASDSGYTGSMASITRGAGPFNRCTNLAIAPSGDLYVSDGYGNARVHRFSAAGKLIQSWGEPGTGPGQFNLPHGVAIESTGEVWVADRENDRIQIFTADGKYLREWTQVQRPTQVRIQAGRVYVAELWWRVGQQSMRHGPITTDHFGRISVFDMAGNLLGRIEGGPNPARPGGLVAPHDCAVDSKGNIYVGEVTETFAVKPGVVPAGTHCFQKFAAG